MAINGFDGDFELSLGSVIGVRAFKLDWLGRLVGVSQDDKVFTPEVNTAQCFRCQLKRLSTCECGFYGYFSGQDNEYMRGNPVGAIIEGTGKTILGTKGFRTEKAKLLALFPMGGSGADEVRGPVRLTKYLYPRQGWFEYMYSRDIEMPAAVFTMIVGIVFLIIGTISLFTSDWEIGTWMIPAGLWLAGLWSRLYFYPDHLHRIRDVKKRGKTGPDPFDRLRELYPDVPVYRSLKEAVKNHPLSTAEEHIPEPVLPSPSTEDNFWELSTTPRRGTHVYPR